MEFTFNWVVCDQATPSRRLRVREGMATYARIVEEVRFSLFLASYFLLQLSGIDLEADDDESTRAPLGKLFSSLSLYLWRKRSTK
jgi:hypothetical protein